MITVFCFSHGSMWKPVAHHVSQFKHIGKLLNRRLTAVRAQETYKDLDCGSLARPVGTKEPKSVSGPDLQR